MSPEPSRAVSRRRVVRTAGTAAWAAPVIVAVSAAPAHATSLGVPPQVSVQSVQGVRRAAFGGIVDCSIAFDNAGGAASALSVNVDFIVAVPGTSLVYGVGDVSSPWMASPHTVTAGGQRVTFTRAGGLGANLLDTLTFTINSPMGTGNIVVSAPTTTPPGANTGSSGVWGEDANPIDMDVIGLNFNTNTGVFSLTVKNNGAAPVAPHTVAVTFTPTSGTFAFNNDVQGNPAVTANPPIVAPTSSPTTIEFTNTIPANTNTSVAFQLGIVRTGGGTVSATVVAPDSPKNNTRTGSYT